MIRLNLLPHRAARRQEQKKAFQLLLLLALLGGCLLVLAVGSYFSRQLDRQAARNQFIQAENTRLDEKILEVASLRQDIAALQIRQQAVENLQGERNQPVQMLAELVRQVPEGVYLKSFKQEGQRVRLSGQALSNARVSALLRNLNTRSAWLEKPELIEIRSGANPAVRNGQKTFDFIMDVHLRGPQPADAEQAGLPDLSALSPAVAEREGTCLC